MIKADSEKSQMMEDAAIKGRSLWQDAMRRLRQNRAASISIGLLGFISLLAIFGPIFWPHAYDTIYTDRVAQPPSWENLHILGTDLVGRDLFIRLLYGLRISLAVGVIATLVSLVIGVSWGTLAGFIGGKTDQIMMRIVDVIYAIPFIFFVILLTVAFGRNIFLIFLAIGAVEWLTMARIVRGQTLSLKNKEFVEAAKAIGVSWPQIIWCHILPNILGPVAVYVTLTLPVVILAESFLSFLGLGVNEPLTSLGVLIAHGKEQLGKPWLLLPPAITMMITLLCLNFVGDGLRDALDPKDR